MLNAIQKDGISTITARGELDRFDCTELQEQFDNAADRVELDMARVSFIDSRCARMVSEEAERLRNLGKPLRMKASPQVVKMLEMLAAAGIRSARSLLFDLKIIRISVA